MSNSETQQVPEMLAKSREARLLDIQKQTNWDLIIIGGGVTGAGIFYQASKLGLKALLLEQSDFAWGSSSRSSKMVHGGLRYIADGHIKLTMESVRERNLLMNEAQGLVSPLTFAMTHYKRQFPTPWIFNRVLSFYDWISGGLSAGNGHRFWNRKNSHYIVPGLNENESLGCSQFADAITDDSRLVLRLIQEGQQLGGLAVNYLQVEELVRTNGLISGVKVVDQTDKLQTFNVSSSQLINASGPWAAQFDAFRENEDRVKGPNLRPLRGSHIVVPSWRLPVACAVSVFHPKDNRPVQIFPWQHVTLIGTTDVDHDQGLNKEPSISQSEYDYLMTAVNQVFPNAKITEADVISTFAGIRSIVTNGKHSTTAPSKEKREHSIWFEPGLATIAGGKLTTFRVIANEVLNHLAKKLNLSTDQINQLDKNHANYWLNCGELKTDFPVQALTHIKGCYGSLAPNFIATLNSATQTPISYSENIWGQLAWAAKYEQVIHLDDLLLRRTRLGNVLPEGGMGLIKQIKETCIKELDWSESKWSLEVERYKAIWLRSYSSPSKHSAIQNDE